MASSSLLPYIPKLVSTWPAELPPPSFRSIDGSMLFADISGFTRLSEQLAKQGRVGAEELVNVINSTFARLLAVAYGEEGGLLKFGGDALLLFFSGKDHALRAARSAAGMRRTLREIGKIPTSSGSVSLRISMGMHSDRFDFFLVGNSHMDLVITGPAASLTVAMEQIADAGEIVLSREAAFSLPALCRGEPKGDGILLKKAPPGTSHTEKGAWQESSFDISQFVPVDIREHLVAGGEGAAHRQVTVMFIHFDGIDNLSMEKGTEAVCSAVHELVCVVQEAAEKHGISYLDSDIDKDGGKIYLAAGAPVARDDDEGRALRAALQVIGSKTRIPVRIGVHRGHTFTGDIGPPYRRTYTFMGDAVNLAARVMARANPGELLATTEVLEVSGTSFVTTPIEPFKAKGKSQLVKAFRVDAVAGRKVSSVGPSRFVGRTKELETLSSALDQALAGNGALVDVIGEPGIGKSRLIEEMRTLAPTLQTLDTICEPYDKTSPYSAFKPMLRRALGIEAEGSPEELEEGLRGFIYAKAMDLDAWLPLVAIPFGLTLADTEETLALEEQFKRAKLEESIQSLLDFALTSPTMFVFEDAHWMDEASADLLRYLAAQAASRSWLICTVRRSSDSGFKGFESPGAITVELDRLEHESVLAMMIEATEESPLLPHEVEALATTSAGNPMFAEELLEWTSSGGVETLPDSLEKAIAIRIDGLPPRDRTALRLLSVLGLTFKAELAEAVLDADAGRAGRFDDLYEFLEQTESGFRFRQALIREAAYAALPYRSRQQLHARVAEQIEKTSPDPEAEAGVLSMHYFEAKRHEQAWQYSRLAAEHASKTLANVEAVQLYERALEAARQLSDVDSSERAQVLEDFADVLMLIGEFDKAIAALGKARKLVSDDAIKTARLIQRQVRATQRVGRLSTAIRWISKGLNILDGIQGIEASSERANLLMWYSSIRQEQGLSEEAIKWSRRSIDQAQASGAKQALAFSLNALAAANLRLGKLKDPGDWNRALSLFDELDDVKVRLTGRSAVLNNLGAYSYAQGQWDDAVDYYERARLDWEKLGNAPRASVAIYNIAEILTNQGRLDEAEAYARHVHRVWRASGNKGREAAATGLLARITYRSGHYEEARAMLDEARVTLSSVGTSTLTTFLEALTAECNLLERNFSQALRSAMNTLARIVDKPGDSDWIPLLHRIKGQALQGLGDEAQATEALEASLEVARALGNRYETALTLQALSSLRTRDERKDLEREASLILQELGVRGAISSPDPRALIP